MKSLVGPLMGTVSFCLFSALVACSGESAGEAGGCELPGQAQYRVQYYERSGGTCGLLDSTTGLFFAGKSLDVRDGTAQSVSLDQCNTSGAGGDDHFEIGWSRNGSIGIGTYVHNTDECSSVYDLIVTLAQ